MPLLDQLLKDLLCDFFSLKGVCDPIFKAGIIFISPNYSLKVRVEG